MQEIREHELRLPWTRPITRVGRQGPGHPVSIARYRQTRRRRLLTAARWPLGVALTSWRYVWRTTPMHRSEVAGSPETDAPPELPPELEQRGVQLPVHGHGPLFHRLYRARIRGSELTPRQLIGAIRDDPDRVAPREFATFQRLDEGRGRMQPGDDYVVRMAGPWDGPVRTVDASPDRFRLATLEGHLEAGQIEFRSRDEEGHVVLEIESWARSKDRLTDLLYNHLRMSKEVQLHMWTSTLERASARSGGTLTGGLEIRTWKVDLDGET